MNKNNSSNSKTRARSLRENQTKSEGLLWSILRAKQVYGLSVEVTSPSLREGRAQRGEGSPWFV